MKVFSLRTLALAITIKGRLFGNSMFWIFTRVKDNIELSKPVCILKKMPDSQRVFCIFGQMVEKSAAAVIEDQQHNKNDTFEGAASQSNGQSSKMMFKFFKNQEIPEFFYNLDNDVYMK
jgi:hypothetical protein